MRTPAQSQDGEVPFALPARYVAAIDALARLLRAAKAQIDSSCQGDELSTLNRVHEWALPRWRKLVGVAAAVARPLRADPRAFAVCKEQTRAALLPLLGEGPIWRRSHDKPRGYPGDFEILNFVYDRKDQGVGVFARLCHRLGLDVGDCVRTRMKLLLPELEAQLSRSGDDVQLLSVGCGSAREVPAALASATPARRARFLLLDQDPGALASASSVVEGTLARLAPGMVTVEYLNLDYRRLLRDPDALTPWGRQDVVYCVGLLDYLPQDHLEPFVGLLLSLLKPGGLLILGNMKEPTDTFWPLECVLDWHLNYRTEAQMRQLATTTGVGRSELLLEETGNNFILKLWKDVVGGVRETAVTSRGA